MFFCTYSREEQTRAAKYLRMPAKDTRTLSPAELQRVLQGLRYNRYIADQNRLALAGAICSSLRAAKDITEEHPLS